MRLMSAFDLPQFGIGPLCDEVVDHPLLFAGGQIEDICREALFSLGQRPGHHLCEERAAASKQVRAQRRKGSVAWLESDDLRDTHGGFPPRGPARSIGGRSDNRISERLRRG
jgi:hypothetical protein